MPPPKETSLLTHRMVSVPRTDGSAAELRARMLPALALAHSADRSVACCWIRGRPGGPFALLVGGTIADGVGTGPVPFPAGGRGIALRPDQVVRATGLLAHWKRSDLALECLPDSGSTDESSAGPSLEDLFGLLPDQAMAVLTVAGPLGGDVLAARVGDLSDVVDDLESRRSGRGGERVRLRRAEAEIDYFEHAGSHGLWELRLWTAAADAAGCDAVAAMVGSGADVLAGRLRVRPRPPVAGAGSTLAWADRGVCGPREVITLVRPPTRELPGIRLVTAPDFDLTPETPGELALGSVLDATGEPSLPFGVTSDSVNRHVLVTGATGSGKSQTVRTLLESLTRRGVPWLVIEPAKAEYARMAGRVAPRQVLVIRPGDPSTVPGSLNPLEPSSLTIGGERVVFPLQTHVDLVRALFTASFEAQEPFPQILARALTRCYEALGWNLALGRSLDAAPGVEPRWPRLSDLQRHALEAVDDIGYGTEVRQNMRGFVGVRVDSLRAGTPGLFFEGGHPLDLERLLDHNVVFEIEDLGDDNDKAFFIGCVLLRLFELLRLREQHGTPAPGLAHVTVVEEAHRLLRTVAEGSAAAQAVTMFATLFAEVRSYGEGIVVAEQIPAKLVPDVVKNSAVKLVHRLPAKDDRDLVGSSMNLDDAQSAHVVSLEPGVAVAHTDGMDRPVLVGIDASGRARESRSGAVTTPPVGRRGDGCPRTCAVKPCTLDRIVRAERLSETARIRLWAEIAVLAHLIGEPLGRLSVAFADRLRSLEPDLVTCAIGTAVDAAVDRRSGYVQRYYDPRDLARHLATLLRRQRSSGLSVGEPEPRWLVGPYRWVAVIRALQAPAVGSDDPAKPHPHTAAWAALGLDVPGTSWHDQEVVATSAARAIGFRTGPLLRGEPYVLDESTSLIVRDDDPVRRLTTALAWMGLDTSWPAHRLRTCWE